MEAGPYIIKQISVFSENKPGRLAAIAHALGEVDVNILAFSIADAEGFGVVRALVDNPDTAYKKLTGEGFSVTFTDVIAVRMQDHPGGLYQIAKILGDSGINMEYAYAYTGREGAVLIIRVDRTGPAIDVLGTKGGDLLKSSVFY